MNEWDRWSIPAEAEIIFLFGLLFAFFARDIRVCFTKGINKFGFMVRRNIQGFLCGYKDGRETVMERLVCNTTRSAATMMLTGFGSELG